MSQGCRDMYNSPSSNWKWGLWKVQLVPPEPPWRADHCRRQKGQTQWQVGGRVERVILNLLFIATWSGHASITHHKKTVAQSTKTNEVPMPAWRRMAPIGGGDYKKQALLFELWYSQRATKGTLPVRYHTGWFILYECFCGCSRDYTIVVRGECHRGCVTVAAYIQRSCNIAGTKIPQ